MERDPMLLAVGFDLDESAPLEQFPVHVRMDDDTVYVDIHVGDKVYGMGIPWIGLMQLSDLIDRMHDEEETALPPMRPPQQGKELLN